MEDIEEYYIDTNKIGELPEQTQTELKRILYKKETPKGSQIIEITTNPFDESYKNDVLSHVKKLTSVKDKLDFLQKHAVTNEMWNLFQDAITEAYIKKHLYTSDDMKSMIDKITILESRLFAFEEQNHNV